MERKSIDMSDDQSISQSHKMKKPEMHKKYANKDVIPRCDLWTDGLICAFEFIRGHKRSVNSKAGSKILSDGEYLKKEVPADGLSEASPRSDRSRLQEYLSLDELRSNQNFSFDDKKDSHTGQSGQFIATEKPDGSHWVPIGWARISELVPIVQVDGEWASQQLELMDGEDDIAVADLAAPYWKRPAGPIWWCHVAAGHPSVEAWLNSAQWLHPAVSLALRDESRLISERMKYLLYEVIDCLYKDPVGMKRDVFTFILLLLLIY